MRYLVYESDINGGSMAKNEKLKTLVDNLNVFRSRSSISNEQIDITLSHIASMLCDTHKDASPEEIDAHYKRLVSDVYGAQKIILYKEMIKHPALLDKMKAVFSIGNDVTAAGSHGKISYVKNDLNNVAFELLTQKTNNVKPVWETSFVQACESVSDNKSEFCILPIESSSDGKLLGFYSMIERYELKIVSVCEVDDLQGETAKYALISKSCPASTDLLAKGDLNFEFSLLSQDCEFMSEIISAAKVCEAKLQTVCFAPVKYDSNLQRYILSFSIPSRELLPFKAFLALTYHSYTPIGCYKDNK